MLHIAWEFYPRKKKEPFVFDFGHKLSQELMTTLSSLWYCAWSLADDQDRLD